MAPNGPCKSPVLPDVEDCPSFSATQSCQCGFSHLCKALWLESPLWALLGGGHHQLGFCSPTMSGQRTGRQGRTDCRHPRTLAEHAVHVRAFRATQTPTQGCCQCKDTAQKGKGRLAPVGPQARDALVYGNRCWLFECRAGGSPDLIVVVPLIHPE